MPYGLYVSAAGANSQARRIEVISNNLANVDTAGFKREISVLQARHAALIGKGEAPPGAGGIDDVGGGVFMEETHTDYSQGVMRRTNAEADFAIDGDGFFVVETGEGKRLLTRAGNFHFSPDGRLLTQQGYQVLADDNAPVTITPTIPWRFFEHGSIRQAGAEQYLALVRPQSPADLVRVGENTFAPLAAYNNLGIEDRRVRKGYLELAGVKPTATMMELIEASRAYEMNVRMIQHHDHMLGSLVNRVLRQTG